MDGADESDEGTPSWTFLLETEAGTVVADPSQSQIREALRSIETADPHEHNRSSWVTLSHASERFIQTLLRDSRVWRVEHGDGEGRVWAVDVSVADEVFALFVAWADDRPEWRAVAWELVLDEFDQLDESDAAPDAGPPMRPVSEVEPGETLVDRYRGEFLVLQVLSLPVNRWTRQAGQVALVVARGGRARTFVFGTQDEVRVADRPRLAPPSLHVGGDADAIFARLVGRLDEALRAWAFAAFAGDGQSPPMDALIIHPSFWLAGPRTLGTLTPAEIIGVHRGATYLVTARAATEYDCEQIEARIAEEQALNRQDAQEEATLISARLARRCRHLNDGTAEYFDEKDTEWASAVAPSARPPARATPFPDTLAEPAPTLAALAVRFREASKIADPAYRQLLVDAADEADTCAAEIDERSRDLDRAWAFVQRAQPGALLDYRAPLTYSIIGHFASEYGIGALIEVGRFDAALARYAEALGEPLSVVRALPTPESAPFAGYYFDETAQIGLSSNSSLYERATRARDAYRRYLRWWELGPPFDDSERYATLRLQETVNLLARCNPLDWLGPDTQRSDAQERYDAAREHNPDWHRTPREAARVLARRLPPEEGLALLERHIRAGIEKTGRVDFIGELMVGDQVGLLAQDDRLDDAKRLIDAFAEQLSFERRERAWRELVRGAVRAGRPFGALLAVWPPTPDTFMAARDALYMATGLAEALSSLGLDPLLRVS